MQREGEDPATTSNPAPTGFVRAGRPQLAPVDMSKPNAALAKVRCTRSPILVALTRAYILRVDRGDAFSSDSFSPYPPPPIPSPTS